MNKTVELVNLWGAYEEKHPGGSIADFCRYHLMQQRKPVERKKLTGSAIRTSAAALRTMRSMA